jgi:hypothetical protein
VISNVIDIIAKDAEFREGGVTVVDGRDKLMTDASISGPARSDLIGRQLVSVDKSVSP